MCAQKQKGAKRTKIGFLFFFSYRRSLSKLENIFFAYKPFKKQGDNVSISQIVQNIHKKEEEKNSDLFPAFASLLEPTTKTSAPKFHSLAKLTSQHF